MNYFLVSDRVSRKDKRRPHAAVLTAGGLSVGNSAPELKDLCRLVWKELREGGAPCRWFTRFINRANRNSVN